MKFHVGKTYEYDGRRVTLISVDRSKKPLRASVLFQSDRVPHGGETVRIRDVHADSLRPVRSFRPFRFLRTFLP